MHFIYVMQETDKDKLLELGYQIYKIIPENNIWIFLNKDNLKFSYNNKELDDAHILYMATDNIMF